MCCNALSPPPSKTEVPAYEAYVKVRDVKMRDPKRLAQAQALYAEMVSRGQS